MTKLPTRKVVRVNGWGSGDMIYILECGHSRIRPSRLTALKVMKCKHCPKVTA